MIYINRIFSDKTIERVCRLTYKDDLEDMEFAIYKYSTEKYRSDEFYFPGMELVDGTIEGQFVQEWKLIQYVRKVHLYLTN